MATRKKANLPVKKRPTNGKNMLSQLGLMDLPGIGEDDDDIGLGSDPDDDDDLEAELQAVLSGKVQPRSAKAPKKNVELRDVEMMAKQAMKEITSDDDEDTGDLSNDEDLMSELMDITSLSGNPSSTGLLKRETSPPTLMPSKVQAVNTGRAAAPQMVSGIQNLLQERLTSYKEAEAAAKALGETTKARRFSRGAKTLETLIKEVKGGREISEDDIPPAVSIPKASPAPLPASPVENTQPAPEESTDSSPTISPSKSTPEQPTPFTRRTPSQKRTDNTLSTLTTRRDQYKLAALNAKKTGDMSSAIKYVKISKQFDSVIEALSTGKPIDLSKMPPPPPGFSQQTGVSPPTHREAPPVPTQAPTVPTRAPAVPAHAPTVSPQNLQQQHPATIQEEEPTINIPDEPEDPNLFNAPPPPSNILEALNQRLEKYKVTLTAAQVESNASRAKRLARIVKQYEDAIKSFKAGRPVDYDSLPAPPGFGSIPGVGAAAAAVPNAVQAPTSAPVAPKVPVKNAGQQIPASVAKNVLPKGVTPLNTAVKPSLNSVLEKQLTFLNERHRLFREAALESKKNGDLIQAKEYLRMAKGIEPMIEATRCGLPIDATSVPTPPQLMEDFVILDKTDCLPEDWIGDKEELFRNLERDLTRQFEICERNRDHFKSLGDVASDKKFDKLAVDTKRDMNVVHSLWSKGSSLPKFHYETRIFTLVQSHTNLGDNELELTVMRGINLPGKPTDLDSYIKIEFPYPPESPQRQKTHTIKDTNNPEFLQTFKFEMNRKSRSLARIFKRHPVKLEVWSKGGIFRSDTMIGTAQVRLEELEKKCTIHDSFDLLEGRKACGGKLEVKICIREPLFAKHVEEVRERWLVIGS